MSDSPGLVDFAIGLDNSVFNLPNGQVMFFQEFEEQKNCEINSARQKAFGASSNDVWASKCYNPRQNCRDNSIYFLTFAPYSRLP